MMLGTGHFNQPFIHASVAALILVTHAIQALAQSIDIQPENQIHYRGISFPTVETVWFSGTSGRVLCSNDGGATFRNIQIPGAGGLDLRDIEAWSDREAVVMSSGKGVSFFRTKDGGINWHLTYQDTDTNIFMDGMAFRGDTGLAFGDPLDGQWILLFTTDRGATWRRLGSTLPSALPGEAGFAASGTSIVATRSAWHIATGGGKACRVYTSTDNARTWTATELPIRAGANGGIFSLSFADDENGMAVGGNYMQPLVTDSNCATTPDGGKTWQPCGSYPPGYRSCVAHASSVKTVLATGTSGTDISYDGGKTWEILLDSGFNVLAIRDERCWFAGKDGTISQVLIELSKVK